MGADVGATLAKLAARTPEGELHLRYLPSEAIERAAREVESFRPSRVALTGGGASRLAPLLSDLDTTSVDEFAAWGVGTRALLERQGVRPGRGDLIVSIGTGTAMLLDEGQRDGRARWVGGTALGGGTLLGLGSALLGTSDFGEIVRLAASGDRRRVDLLVADIYPEGELALPGEMNAASFAKLARRDAPPAERADLAQALLFLLGENVALLCAAVAARVGARRIVLGGATLRDNEPLHRLLERLATPERPVVLLEDGEYAGAVGALEVAAAA